MHVHTFHGRNVNHILPTAILMFKQGWNVQSVVGRGGLRTLEHHGPVVTTYMNPCERVLFDPVRNAHPYFHFFEALWILAGRNDVKWLDYFLQNIKKYSDDGVTYHGAYGHRLRVHFGEEHDQLKWVVEHLNKDPLSRRAVITMFDSMVDHEERSKDIPCNLALDFLFRRGRLHLTVHNRSNDMVWGAYGANVVQFSSVLEYVAGCLGMPVGSYSQVSNSFHVYEDEPTWQHIRDSHQLLVLDPYEEATLGEQQVEPYDMFKGIQLDRQKLFDIELKRFMHDTEEGMQGTMISSADYRTPYFREVVSPLFNSWMCYKHGSKMGALSWLAACGAQDWRTACNMWLKRKTNRA